MTEQVNPANENKSPENTKIILGLYLCLTVSLLIGFIPVSSVSVLSLIIFTVTFIFAYVIRGKAEEGSITDNHMTFIIRTIWYASFILIPFAIAGAIYLYSVIDNTPLYECMDKLAANGNLGSVQLDQLMMALRPCMEDFILKNKTFFVTGLLISTGPIIVYFFYRIIRGLSYILKGQIVTNPKSLF
jgi:uncharacterized membrane protein